jgi:3-isopropylmalate/(R)-2-methylmalate dehydratase small subunit
MSNDIVVGRVWKFGANINTDLMCPAGIQHASPEEQAARVFEANRPNWVKEVRNGDFIVAGKNFGMGSSRPGARSLRNIGITCLIADSINGLFFRNCVNFGLLALECPGISDAFDEGEEAVVSVRDFTIRNSKSDRELLAAPIPPDLLSIISEGGLIPLMEHRNMIKPKRSGTSQY